MPTLDALDYERFSYDDPNEHNLALDEAIKKAKEQRRTDPANFYRVEPANASGTEFRVSKVSVASVYAEFVSRIAQRLVRGTALRRP